MRWGLATVSLWVKSLNRGLLLIFRIIKHLKV